MKAAVPTPRRARRTQRIEAILAAAQAVFLELGYEATSLDAVARRANASKATIYAHFGNKLGLFEAIMRSVIAQVQMPLQAPGAASATETLTRVGTGFLTLMTSPAPLAFYRLIVTTGAEMPELTQLWFENGPRRIIGAIGAFLAERTAAGELDVPDPDTAAELFLMSLRGTVHLQALTGLIHPPFDALIAAKVRAAVAMFMRAYGVPKPRPSRSRRS